MSEIGLAANGRNAITVRLESNNVTGRDLAGVPALFFPLELQLLPGGDKGDEPYTLLRLAGTLQNQQHSEFAAFEVGPMAEPSTPQAFFRQKQVTVPLDRVRVKRFEDARAGNDANFGIMLSCLLWHPAQQKFEAVWGGPLQVQVPKSHWIERVLSSWNLSDIKIVEIRFPGSDAGESFRNSYARVEEAEKQFASGQYKQVLTTLRLSFEGLAKSLGSEKASKEFFESLFASVHPEKKEKARDALTFFYKFLHLGPHEQANHPDSDGQPVVTRQDARFALIMAHAVFEYITPET
ncbi:MAG: hypothetical protein ACREQ5_03535 [Candidatus Dormibacteria bacterium]